eukprot:Rmarinus@m.9040
MSLRTHLFGLITSRAPSLAVIFLLLLWECIANTIIVLKVPYTEIDWKAYMDEVGGVLGGQYDYMELRGDTGPLVYPAGFVYIYAFLHYLTDGGIDIRTGQYIFAGLHVIFVAVVFLIYRGTGKVPAYALAILCLSKRIHSIFVLRLFNDCVAMFLAYLAIYCFMRHRWTIGCCFYSFAVSVKMNILLMAPGLLLLLLRSLGLSGAVKRISLCGVIQLVLAVPFLLENPIGYISRSFDLGRKFFYVWTVNWKFLPEETFLDSRFSVFLLIAHVAVLVGFLMRKCTRGGITENTPSTQSQLSGEFIVYVLFVSNFIGIVFSRTLHYQFYVWYYHMLPFLLWAVPWPTPLRIVFVCVTEIVWNVYPSVACSSLTLQVLNWSLLVSLLYAEIPSSTSLDTKKHK